MRIIALSTLKSFWEDNSSYLDATEPALAWYRHSLKADWVSPTEVKQEFGNASILRDDSVVFNIAGNKYRLVAESDPKQKETLIRLITHKLVQWCRFEI